MRKAFISLVFIVSFGASAQALDCDDAMTQSAMNACAQEAWVKADEDLNDTYAWAMDRAHSMSEKTAEALRTAQRAWIPYRDAACDAEGILFEGGSIQPLIVYTCLEHLTRQRTEEMRAVYEMN